MITTASQLCPSHVGYTITFDGPGGSKVSDELVSFSTVGRNAPIEIMTRNVGLTAPAPTFFRMPWRLKWDAVVEITPVDPEQRQADDEQLRRGTMILPTGPTPPGGAAQPQ